MNIKNEWFTIENAGNKLIVKVKVPVCTRHNDVQKMKIKTSDVKRALDGLGHKLTACVQDPGPIRNIEPTQSEKTWIFELEQEIKKPAQTKKNPKKVKKTLDKSPEDVIIYIQEETLPSKED